jgi:hypothetical protein
MTDHEYSSAKEIAYQTFNHPDIPEGPAKRLAKVFRYLDLKVGCFQTLARVARDVCDPAATTSLVHRVSALQSFLEYLELSYPEDKPEPEQP